MEAIPASPLQEGSGPDGLSTPVSSHFGSAFAVINDKQNDIGVPFGPSVSSLDLGYPLQCVHR